MRVDRIAIDGGHIRRLQGVGLRMGFLHSQVCDFEFGDMSNGLRNRVGQGKRECCRECRVHAKENQKFKEL